MDQLNQDFLDLMAAFSSENVQYLIVGGWAVNHFGYSRTTSDIDFWLKDDKTNRSNLIQAFKTLEYGDFKELLNIPFIPGFCEIYLDFGIYADLLSKIHGFQQSDFDNAFENRKTTNIRDIPIFYINYENLIASKSHSDRNKDKIDVEELEKINKL